MTKESVLSTYNNLTDYLTSIGMKDAALEFMKDAALEKLKYNADMFIPYQLCPLCQGSREVVSFNGTSVTNRCGICNGEGIIPMLEKTFVRKS